MDEIGGLETRLNNEYRNHRMGGCCISRLVGNLHATPLTHLYRAGDFRGRSMIEMLMSLALICVSVSVVAVAGGLVWLCVYRPRSSRRQFQALKR